jgi:predicted glycoside hydrolase/deacetylase ChbG (UPF0249 family)
MRYLIVNADDFGYSRGVSDGIVEAYTHGILTSASLMVLRPAAAYAAELAREHQRLSVGLHFDDGVEADLDDPAQLQRALDAQLARFRELTGTDPTHVDSHHHSHHRGDRAEPFDRLAAKLGVPLRFDGRIQYIGEFWAENTPGVIDLDDVSRAHLIDIVRTGVQAGFTEIGCHPGRITGDLRSSYTDPREVELATLTEPGLREEIEASGVELVSFRDWRALSQR